MARPRVFISSTFYDLKQVRADLFRFVKDMGYDPVDNNKGSIPYGPDLKLEEYCYKEIDSIDILVAIVGGRYGSGSQHKHYSVSQMEIKTAVERGKQVYIFVAANVLAEFDTYLLNKEHEKFKYAAVDNRKIYEFIEEVQSYPNNNAMASFETSENIIDFLKEQWSGLFQRFLQEQSRQKEYRILEDMQKTAHTLNQLVNFLTEERRNSSDAIQNILFSNHPAFTELQNLLSIEFRVYFTNKTELDGLLSSCGFHEDGYYPDNQEGPYHDWFKQTPTFTYWLGVSRQLFDSDGKLKIYTPQDWDEEMIKMIASPVKPRKQQPPTTVAAPIASTPYPEDDFDDNDPFADQ
jgi:hypothetical protein